MSIVHRIVAVAGIAALAAGSAAAQDYRAAMSPRDSARAALNTYAACLVEHDRQRTLAYLDLPAGSGRAAAASGELAAMACMRYGNLTYSETALRGAAYIALVNQAARRSMPGLPLKPVDYASDGAGRDQLFMREFADCVVHADFGSSLRAVISPVGGDTERDAYNRLSLTYSACMTQGSTARLDRATLAGLLAEAIYRGTTGE